jgi:NTP pyrophosphatase (non-canonical NTP hydrolase)
MLGKASEIKMAVVSAAADQFELALREWCDFVPNAMIQDIKLTATAIPGQCDWLHAIIIYNEPEQTVETPIKPRESVQWFAEVMENKLRENDHKGGWDECHIDWLIHRLYQEAEELWREVRSNDKNYQNIISESADVANFAMMIADKARKEAKP